MSFINVDEWSGTIATVQGALTPDGVIAGVVLWSEPTQTWDTVMPNGSPVVVYTETFGIMEIWFGLSSTGPAKYYVTIQVFDPNGDVAGIIPYLVGDSISGTYDTSTGIYTSDISPTIPDMEFGFCDVQFDVGDFSSGAYTVTIKLYAENQ